MAKKAEDVVFLDYFDDLPIPRMSGKIVYPMSELLLLSLCAMISGCESWLDIEQYGQHKLNYLRKISTIRVGITKR